MKHQDKQLSQRMYQVVPAPALIMVLGVVLLGLLCPGLQAEARSNNTLARRLVTMGGVERGLCVVIGGPSALPVQVARSSHLVVHVREPKTKLLLYLKETLGQTEEDSKIVVPGASYRERYRKLNPILSNIRGELSQYDPDKHDGLQDPSLDALAVALALACWHDYGEAE